MNINKRIKTKEEFLINYANMSLEDRNKIFGVINGKIVNYNQIYEWMRK